MDTTGQYANVGAMMATLGADYGGDTIPFCTGTLVHPRVFLTAGHCTHALTLYLMMGIVTDVGVSFDAAPVNKPFLPISGMYTHPNYGHDSGDLHDAGAMVLAAPVTGITPATVAPEGFLDELNAAGKLKHGSDRAMMIKVGYGGTLAWPPPYIYYEDQRQWAYSEFQNLRPAWLQMNQNTAATGAGGTCYGDSGGPAFYETEGGDLVLVGLTSWGDMQCVASGIDYRVDIPQTLDFLAGVIAAL
jgi:secreted trypsin-like serine protease